MATHKLTDSAVRAFKPGLKQYRVADGGGLSLVIHPQGGKYWRQRYRRPVSGRAADLALGTYPDVTLRTARERSLEARRLLADGIDPGHQKKARKRAESGADTLEAVAREWHEHKKGGWSDNYAECVIRRLEINVFPWLGDYPVDKITASALLEVLRRVEARDAIETAHRVLGYLRAVFVYAIVTERATGNPASDLKGALEPSRTKHMAAITDPKELAPLLRAIDSYAGTYVVRCALQLAPLTFLRPGELRCARWSEIDFEAAEWRIPAERMKMKFGHLVPLARQSIEVLKNVEPLSRGNSEYVFPAIYNNTRPMSEGTISQALKRLGYSGEEMTGHGFRATARTLLDESLGFRIEHIEMQLSHTVRDVHGRAYNRTQYLDKRREMMQAWADYLDDLRANV